MAPLTTKQRQDAAAVHADRAHELLAEAEVAWTASGGKTTGQADAHRVALAQAHAETAIALSALILPAVAPPAPASPTPSS